MIDLELSPATSCSAVLDCLIRPFVANGNLVTKLSLIVRAR
jgi:hypothetical protein